MDTSSASCIGVLLAGGSARRFGGAPKGLSVVDGVRIADRALAALSEASDGRMVVANDPAAAEWFPAERVVRDVQPGLGPLGGIATALEAAGGASVLVVAWDMPFVTGELLRALRETGERTGQHVVPMPYGGQLSPLCAYYRPSALATCRALLDAGERRARALAEALPDVLTLGREELRAFGEPARLFTSVDTLELLHALRGTPPGEVPAPRR